MNGLPLPDRTRWLLQACLRDDARAVDAFRQWRRFANPERMDGRELRLAPLLHANMKKHGLADERLAWIGGQAKHIWLTGALRRRQFQTALGQLAGAGVSCVLMKGAALAARFPESVKVRPMGDFDLLVPVASVPSALSILKASGWREASGATPPKVAVARHHALNLWNSTGASIDLHWRPAAAIADSQHAAGVLDRSNAAVLDGRPVAVASLTDHLFIVLCRAFHDMVEQRSEWIADVDFLFQAADPGAWNWRLFRRLARGYRLDVWMRQTLETVQDVTGRAPPRGAFRLFDAVATRGRSLQAREIELRGQAAESLFDREARARGRIARGLPGEAIDRALEPARAVALAIRSQPLIPNEADRVGQTAFPKAIVFLEGWSYPEGGWRWTESDVCVLCIPVRYGVDGEPFAFRLRLTPLEAIRARLAAQAWAGAQVAPLALTADVVEVRGRLMARPDGAPGALAALWLGLDGLFTEEERLAFSDLRRLGLCLGGVDFVWPPIERGLEPSRAVALALRSQALAASRDDRAGGEAFAEGVVFLHGWSYSEGPVRWTDSDVCVLCAPVPDGHPREPFAFRLRMAPLEAIRARMSVEAWAGAAVETLDAESLAWEPVMVRGSLRAREDGEPGALAVLWMGLTGLLSDEERLGTPDSRRLGVCLADMTVLRGEELASSREDPPLASRAPHPR